MKKFYLLSTVLGIVAVLSGCVGIFAGDEAQVRQMFEDLIADLKDSSTDFDTLMDKYIYLDPGLTEEQRNFAAFASVFAFASIAEANPTAVISVEIMDPNTKPGSEDPSTWNAVKVHIQAWAKVKLDRMPDSLTGGYIEAYKRGGKWYLMVFFPDMF